MAGTMVLDEGQTNRWLGILFFELWAAHSYNIWGGSCIRMVLLFESLYNGIWGCDESESNSKQRVQSMV